jgi:hypothetical protein
MHKEDQCFFRWSSLLLAAIKHRVSQMSQRLPGKALHILQQCGMLRTSKKIVVKDKER